MVMAVCITRSAIFSMPEMVSWTMLAPKSAESLVFLEFSAAKVQLRAMSRLVADISSLAVATVLVCDATSSAAVAICSEVACNWAEAAAMPLEMLTVSDMSSRRLCTMLFMAAITLRVSPLATATCTARSPPATFVAMSLTSVGSPPSWRSMPRVISRASVTAASAPRMSARTSVIRAREAVLSPDILSCWAILPFISIILPRVSSAARKEAVAVVSSNFRAFA